MKQHRLFIIALVALQLSFIDTLAQGFNGGVTLGVAATQVDGDTYGGFDKAGPILGFWVERDLVADWFWRANFRFIQKGIFAKIKDSNISDFYRMKLNYFELPFTFGYQFVNGFSAIAGTSVGYLTKATEENSLGTFPDSDASSFRKFEIAALAGMEYNYSENWRFGLMLSYSIIPIRPYNDNISYRMDTGQRNRVIEFLVVYRFQ
jgi:opacity protein-like surface antigen